MIKVIYENEELKEYYERNPLFHKVIRDITQDPTDLKVVLAIKSLCCEIENRIELSEEEIRRLRTGLALSHTNRVCVFSEAQAPDVKDKHMTELVSIHTLDEKLYRQLIRKVAENDETK